MLIVLVIIIIFIIPSILFSAVNTRRLFSGATAAEGLLTGCLHQLHTAGSSRGKIDRNRRWRVLRSISIIITIISHIDSVAKKKKYIIPKA